MVFRKSRGLLIALLLLTSLVVQSEQCHDKEGVVKYVQGGACSDGDGTKKHPFSSLAQASASTWDVLMVLSSTTPLDGGITLKPGQKLIGEEDPTEVALSPTQPTIMNTTSANQGCGIVVTGDATIKNIFIRSTNRHGIQTDKAENLTVKNVRITDFGQLTGDLFGIGGFMEKSGETHLHRVIISDPSNTNFSGILESLSANDIHRELSLSGCELTKLRRGLWIQLVNTGTVSTVDIKDSFMHDFFEVGVGVLSLSSTPNTQQRIMIHDSAFRNVGQDVGNAIYLQPGSDAQYDLKVKNCFFEETGLLNQVDAVLVQSFATSSCVAHVENCTLNNMGFGVQTITLGTSSISAVVKECTAINAGTFFNPIVALGQQKNKICANTVTSDVFYRTEGDTPLVVEQSHLEGNLFTGRLGFAIDTQGANASWKLLTITAKDNCFNGDKSAQSAAFRVEAGNKGAILLTARDNSFSDFTTDISDAGSTANYLVSKNYWGAPTVLCSSGCGAYQVCDHNFCFGPTVVTTGTGFIDASKPLLVATKCPHQCCISNPVAPTPPLVEVQTSDEDRHAKVQEKINLVKSTEQYLPMAPA